MAIETLTREQRQMNRYWWLLAGTLNELLMALDAKDLSDAERLAKIRFIHDFSREKMGRTTPPSVVAENQERADREGEPEPTERERELAAQGKRLYYTVDENGTFHEHVEDIDPNEGPLTDEEVTIMLREGWGEEERGS
jgi:hypothetical protein